MIVLRTLSTSIETYALTAVIDTALCVGAGGSSGSLADKPIVRNSEDNLLIPGSQIKGRLRHECEKIARGLGWEICESPNAGKMVVRRENAPNEFKRNEYEVLGYNDTYHCLISQIFGDPVLPSRIIIDDLICTEDPENLAEFIRPGVTINRRRRTAEENKLYFLETSPPNVSLKFKGQIHLLPNCPSYAKPLMLAGFKHIHALGGSKSAGLGWLSWETLPNFEVTDADWDCLAKGGENAAN
ncbi:MULTISPECIES: RAMP superfamily CRISPR-associated protein [unclassified Microcoleus]|uniref:RAMP superfamily CRISPR-associated protein n=1 Tax=unclassified Microcoleus TaxID=2642155 RepID=UPI001DB99262|nr:MULTISPECIES: RAMP superfamily CRISPR-associated protein [unclassified Microcoleus]MCC3502027.1 CRISPR-associated protein Csm3 [Microcoleus sp. PH2017_19_SFW_U_A]TAE16885.1 MAG: CRISPR-associated protein Csm3 [Oscillatoriales cyanobacterium]MCC3413197.1 CRISPR-associated protein Csm3 [Microcoleus sp. PH2017_02_FOX_O_A]MCC3514657.1 CRISPR-associated protein Csm3 [Microcoleus sp. PH2017_18_LLB_O_A]MCC3520283.1 CRISPR-associated protein Csm3 [Microcoleus sp. PH2017_20_SFW_D_A]